MIGLMFLKELMLIYQMDHISILLVIIFFFIFQPRVCNCCHSLMEKAMSFNDVAVVFGKGNDYRIRFWYMGKDEVTNMMKKFD